MRILILTDGSRRSEKAVRFSKPIARAMAAEVTILGAKRRPGPGGGLREALVKAQEILAEDDVMARTLLRPGLPHHELLRETRSGKYDLLVAGSLGCRGLTRLLFGNRSDYRIIRRLEIPTLLARRPRKTLSKVLICNSGSGPSEAMVRFAGQIVGSVGATTTILHVTPSLPVMYATLKGMDERLAEFLGSATCQAQVVAKGARVLRGCGVDPQLRLRRGLVVDEILAETEEGDYDLIVVGARPLEGCWGLLLDDVAKRVIRYAKRPVLVVKGQETKCVALDTLTKVEQPRQGVGSSPTATTLFASVS